MTDVAIRVEGLSKRYRIGAQQESYRTLRESLVGAVTGPLHRLRHPGAASSPTIWALKDVSFEVKRGEVVGIIGRNGAGKSTLLKILSRITRPTEGYAEVHGRVGSLLEVGTGFHGELTGRENIYLNGAILGMKRSEIERKFDEIVAFSQIEQFLDTPVKRYSSGMYVRLAFAVAAHLEPEILVVDEVLAVGDVEFQKKCLGKMSDVARGGRTILFVSHNMGAINRLCDRSLWIDRGHVRLSGISEDIVSAYLMSDADQQGQRNWNMGIANPGVDELKVLLIRIRNQDGDLTSNLAVDRSFFVEIEYRICTPLPYCRIGFVLSGADGTPVFEAYDTDGEALLGKRDPGWYLISCEIPPSLLNAGSYVISINAGMPNIKNLAWLEGVLTLNIEDTDVLGSHSYVKRIGVIRPRLRWTREEMQYDNS